MSGDDARCVDHVGGEEGLHLAGDLADRRVGGSPVVAERGADCSAIFVERRRGAARGRSAATAGRRFISLGHVELLRLLDLLLGLHAVAGDAASAGPAATAGPGRAARRTASPTWLSDSVTIAADLAVVVLAARSPCASRGTLADDDEQEDERAGRRRRRPPGGPAASAHRGARPPPDGRAAVAAAAVVRRGSSSSSKKDNEVRLLGRDPSAAPGRTL